MADYYGINVDFEDFDRLLKKEDLIQEPVPIQTFVTDKRYLALPKLSDKQLEIAKHITQVFKPHTLVQLHGEEKGLKYFEEYTQNEVVCMLGKGSGKDHTSRISMAYVVYLMHCLRDPLDYYGKALGVNIDLLNLAVNAQQAHNVFFDPLKKILLNSNYFNHEAPFEPQKQQLTFFERPVRCFSGHSEAEGWEGYELLLVILDEIAAFKTEIEVKSTGGDANRAKGSAAAIYNMSKLSIMSRFPQVGKVVLLSFPRFKGDFITTRYDAYKKGNEIKTWGMKAATWEVNPTITREDLEPEYRRNPIEARSRFEAEPPEMEDAFFREPGLVRRSFQYAEDPLYEDGTLKPWFNGADGALRFIHIDLGLKRDKAALCMVHMVGFKDVETMAGMERLPVVDVDFIKAWRAQANEEIPFAAIRKTIQDLSRKFTIASITFDMWQSVDMMQSLKNAGFNADWHTVRKTDYDTLQTAIYDGRLRGYWDEQLVENELLKLKLINNTKVDHPTKGEKDMADALAGAVFKCLSTRALDMEVEVEIWNDMLEDDEYYDEEEAIRNISSPAQTIEPSKKEIPPDLFDWVMDLI